MFDTVEKTIVVQLQELSLDATSIQQTIRVDSLKLEGAREESGRIAEGLTRGTAKESDLTKNRDTIAVLEARIGANTAQLGRIKSKIDELAREHQRQEQQAAKEAREKEFADIVQSIAAEYQAISQAAERLIVDRLWPVTAKAQRLVTEFEDLGGVHEVMKLNEILYAKYPSAAGELHIARLRARGWKPAAYLGGKGGNVLRPVTLAILAMVPPEKK